MSAVIQVENLSKKYILQHQQRANYETLSEKLLQTTRNLADRIRHPLQRTSADVLSEDFWALKDINFEIQQGDKVGIIGRNGAGKSTLLKILSRITAPTTGKITIEGRVASLLEVGTGFHPELTGRENIFLNGAVLGMRKQEIKYKFDAIVDFAEIERFLDTPVKRYSSGMYVRLAFAVAAHLEPEILIVDEVLAVGDAQFQKKCLGKMDDIGNEGRTIIFVSHNLKAIKQLCNNGMVLKSGELKCRGDIHTVIQQAIEDDMEKTNIKFWDKGISNDTQTDLMVTSMRVLGMNDEPLILTNQYFKVKIEFNVLRNIPKFRIGYLMTTLDGVEVIESYNTVKIDKIGRYETESIFPAKLLKSGTYFLSLNAGIPNVINYVYVERAVKFEIADVTKYSDFGLINHRGVINPDIEWTINAC